MSQVKRMFMAPLLSSRQIFQKKKKGEGMPHKALNGRWPSSWGWAWLRVLAVGIWVGLIAAPAWAAEGSQPVVAVWLDPTGTATPDVAFE